MSRLRLNGPLLLGALLACALLAVLLMPLVVDVPDPHRAQGTAEIKGRHVLPPFPPGELGYRWGSDAAGRDIYARVIYGARGTLIIVLLITAMRAVVALPLGFWAGIRQGWAARLVSVLTVSLSTIPGLIFIVFAMPGLRLAVGARVHWIWIFCSVVALVTFPRMADQVRRLTQLAARRPHVEAAISLGAPSGRILRRHIVPLIRGDLLIMAASEMAFTLVMLGQLAVFGIFAGGSVTVLREGLPPFVLEASTEWGHMLSAGRIFIQSKPWVVLSPAVALGLTAACFHLLAEGLRLRSLRR